MTLFDCEPLFLGDIKFQNGEREQSQSRDRSGSGTKEFQGSFRQLPSRNEPRPVPSSGGRRSSYFDKILAQKKRDSQQEKPKDDNEGSSFTINSVISKMCCKNEGVHTLTVTNENIDEIRKQLGNSSRKNPVNVICGSVYCSCSYHYLKDGKLNCVKLKNRSCSHRKHEDQA